jgi:ABC-type Zn uptake system ZnuABC Zn-binding protein ZnuA
MMHRRRRLAGATLALVLALMGFVSSLAKAQESGVPIQVAATVPELGSLAREVGGDQVSVTVFAKGTEDPHFVEAKPSFIKALSRADLYIQLGMGIEAGWAPVLLQNARNGKVLPGAPGHLDASMVVTPLEVPTGPVDRSMGDVHPSGNPHYLLDPLNGLKVAQLIRDRLSELRPAKRQYFAERYDAFRQRLSSALVGEALAQKYDIERLALLQEQGRLASYLKQQGEDKLLGGWLGAMLPYAGTKAVDEHALWPYFARRFGIQVIGHMEPLPGIPPTTKHLGELVERMRAEKVPLVLTSVYYDPRHARFLSERTGAQVVNMANQVGARDGTDDYLRMFDYNVRQLVAALGGGR